MKVYYSHCMAIYDTPQEKRDVKDLKLMGFEVFNPNSSKCDEVVSKIRRHACHFYDPGEKIMDFFMNEVKKCDVLAFRSLPDGSIPAGVHKEIAIAEETGKPIIELPSLIKRQILTVSQTRQYLKEVGQR